MPHLADEVQSLEMLDTALVVGTAGGVRIAPRRGKPWISVPKVEKLLEPPNFGALKESALLTGFDGGFPSVASREVIDLETLRRRLLLRATSNAREDLAPLMDEVDTALASIEPGTVVRIPSDRTADR